MRRSSSTLLAIRIVGLCIIVLYCMPCYAQRPKPLTYSKDTAEINKWQRIARQMENPDSAIAIYKLLVQKAIIANYREAIGGFLMDIGEKYKEMNQFPMSMEYMRRALPYSVRAIDSANCYNHIGIVFFDMGDYVQASENFYTALKYARRTTTVYSNEVGICANLGLVNERLQQYDKALSYYRIGEALARKNNFQLHLAALLTYEGGLYTKRHQPDTARKCLAEAIAIIDTIDVKKNTDTKAEAYKEMGLTYIESKDYKNAIHYLQSAKKIAEGMYEYVVVDASFYLGEAWYGLGDYKQAENILTGAIQEATTSNLRDNIIKGYTTLKDVYSATGQYKKALDCMDSLSVLKDSLVSAEKARSINLMEIRFKTAEKDKQIAQQNSNIARKNIWILSIGAGITLMLLVSAGTYRNILQKQKLHAEKIKSLEQENRIGVLNAVVKGADEERGRIARELHDGVGGMLSAAMLKFSTMYYDNKAIHQIPAYQEALNILYEMGNEIRHVAHNLMPEVLLKQSLPEAVTTYCSRIQEGSSLKVDFQSYGTFEQIDLNFKLNLYRIIQELLKNVAQHAKADHAFVQMLMEGNILTVTVEDNGVGFNYNEISSGMGLHNLQTRVRSLDGHFTLESEPGKGTSVFIEFELKDVKTTTT